MEARTLLLAVALPFAPWAWRVVRALIEEVRVAADGRAPAPRTLTTVSPPSLATSPSPRTPPGGGLPTHGVPGHGLTVRRRPPVRWEAGFGRRHP
jgi:hypothetical protein